MHKRITTLRRHLQSLKPINMSEIIIPKKRPLNEPQQEATVKRCRREVATLSSPQNRPIPSTPTVEVLISQHDEQVASTPTFDVLDSQESLGSVWAVSPFEDDDEHGGVSKVGSYETQSTPSTPSTPSDGAEDVSEQVSVCTTQTLPREVNTSANAESAIDPSYSGEILTIRVNLQRTQDLVNYM